MPDPFDNLFLEVPVSENVMTIGFFGGWSPDSMQPTTVSSGGVAFREWKTSVNIPIGSPEPVYKAFLEMMWRVSRLGKVPANAEWSVEVTNYGNGGVNAHVLRGTWKIA